MNNEYSGHSWIQVKAYREDPEASDAERYRQLLQHHREETEFLIAEVRRLAAERFTAQQVRNYLVACDSYGDAVYYCNTEKIREANEPTSEIEEE